jgi:phosphotransferase system  glucose/maltose/N-acetylglucosamine-specific IIC component
MFALMPRNNVLSTTIINVFNGVLYFFVITFVMLKHKLEGFGEEGAKQRF